MIKKNNINNKTTYKKVNNSNDKTYILSECLNYPGCAWSCMCNCKNCRLFEEKLFEEKLFENKKKN